MRILLSNKLSRWVFRVAGGLLVLSCCVTETALAERYSPLFSQDMLATLDEATRERFAAIEAENYQRWRNRNPQAPDLAAAQRQHAETEAVLRRIQESRELADQAKRRSAPGGQLSAKQRSDCEKVAAEIKELNGGGAFYERGVDGAKRYLSDEEVAARVKRQQKSYNRYCKG